MAVFEEIFTKGQVIIPIALENLEREDLKAEMYVYLSSESDFYYSCNVSEATLLDFWPKRSETTQYLINLLFEENWLNKEMIENPLRLIGPCAIYCRTDHFHVKWYLIHLMYNTFSEVSFIYFAWKQMILLLVWYTFVECMVLVHI